MKVNHLENHEDGSATVKLDLSVEEAQLLMQVGFIKLLEEAIERDTKRRRIPALFQGGYGGNDD